MSSTDALAALAAASMSALITVAVLYGWLRRGVGMPLDVANGRSLHAGAIPRIGGIAMMAGCCAAAATMAVPGVPTVILLAASGLFLLSILDDWRSLSVLPRLLGHLVAAGAVVIELGLPVPLAMVAAIAVVWMTNLYNFMDGADGLAGGMAVIGFGAYALAALPVAPGLAWVCLVLVGAAGGFMIFNFPPARVFMGDAGSIPMGFLAGSFGLAGWQAGAWPAWFPLLVFSPFIADATVTLGRRLYRGERVWQAHRQHYYQRLVLAGWSHRKLALVTWGLMAAVAGSALWLRELSVVMQVIGLLSWGFIFFWAFFLIDSYCKNSNNRVDRSPVKTRQETSCK